MRRDDQEFSLVLLTWIVAFILVTIFADDISAWRKGRQPNAVKSEVQDARSK